MERKGGEMRGHEDEIGQRWRVGTTGRGIISLARSLADDFTTFVRAETLIFRWGKGARSFLVLRTWHGLLQSLYTEIYTDVHVYISFDVGIVHTEGRCGDST